MKRAVRRAEGLEPGDPVVVALTVRDGVVSTPRLVATDLDGTLVHADGSVTDRTRAVLAALEERGVPVVFVTARPLRWMDELWPMVGGHGLAIVSNGAIVVDVAARSVRELRGIGREDGLAWPRRSTPASPVPSIAIETLTGIRVDPSYDDALHPAPPGSPVGPVEEIWTDPAAKVLVRHPGMDPVRFREAVVAAVGVAGGADVDARRADGDQRSRGDEGQRADRAGRGARGRGRRRDRVRRHAQRPADAHLGGHVLRDGQRRTPTSARRPTTSRLTTTRTASRSSSSGSSVSEAGRPVRRNPRRALDVEA